MARPPRSLTVRPNHSVHKVWRGHNREPNLGTDSLKERYLEYLNQDLESERFKQGSVLNALTLMDNHSHELNGVKNPELYSNHMRRHHSRYGMFFNRTNGRCGKVAQDRPHTTLLESELEEMEATFYVHANPIRANIVRDARNYQWSTHGLYAFGRRARWMRNVVLPKWYFKLGRNEALRQRTYRRLFTRYLRVRGRFKQGILKKRFFGSSSWMDKQEAMVKSWRREHAPP